MLYCRASPRDFNAALACSPAIRSICQISAGTATAARMAITARTPINSIKENARVLLRGAQPPRLHWPAPSPDSIPSEAGRELFGSAKPKHPTSNIEHRTSNAVQPEPKTLPLLHRMEERAG